MTKKICFSKGCAFPDDNLKSMSPIHIKCGKYVCYIDVWKSLTFGSDPIQNGRLINDLLNVTIFLNAENAFISETERDRAISTKNLFRRVYGVYWKLFCRNHFPAIFGAHLEFLR